MARNSRSEKNGKHGVSGTLDEDVNALFKLPLAEFTGARNVLAARLKQNGRANDASLVKALTKPSVTAWAVNQLYWNHREAFDSLLTAGQRLRKASSSGKVADMRESLTARRDALTNVTELTASLLRDAGSNPTPETMNRITTTLEALSTYPTSNGPTPGRLTRDVDPPGFDSLVSLMSGAGAANATEKLTRVTPSQKPTHTRKKESRSDETQKARQLEETRGARIAVAKVSLQNAKRSLSEARARAQSFEAEQKNVYAKAKQAEKELREAEERFKKATTASNDAAQRAKSIKAEVEESTNALEDAKRAVEKASKELESLFRES